MNDAQERGANAIGYIVTALVVHTSLRIVSITSSMYLHDTNSIENSDKRLSVKTISYI